MKRVGPCYVCKQCGPVIAPPVCGLPCRCRWTNTRFKWNTTGNCDSFNLETRTLLTSFRKDLCLGGGIYNPARVSVAPYQTLALQTSQAESVRYELDRSRGDNSGFIKSQPQACDPPKERIQILGPSKLTESKADVQV